MRNHFFILLVAALLGLCSSANALDPNKAFHQYVFDAWSIEQGLPQISVSSIVQDQQGYIWIGTQAGLARFDGVTFRTFSSDNTPELQGNYIKNLFADSHGALWIGTYKGLVKHTPNEFLSIQVLGLNGVITPQVLDIQNINEDHQGTIWVATTDGVFSVVNNQLKPLIDFAQPMHSVYGFKQGLFAGGVGELWQLGQQQRSISLPETVRKATINQLLWHQQDLWIATNQGLLFWNFELEQAQLLPESSPLYGFPIDSLGHDSDENLWVGTINGLFRIRHGEVVEQVANNNKHGFQQITAIFEDREKNLWVGSYRDGVGRVWNGRTLRYTTSEGLNEPLVWSVLPKLDGQGIWTGTNQGLSLLKNGHFESVIDAEALPHPTAYTLFEEKDKLWIGTRKGLAIFSEGKVEFSEHHDQLGALQISAIFRDSQQRLWLGTSSGLIEYSEQALRIITTITGERLFIRPVTELSDGRLLIGSQKGLFELQQDQLVAVGLDSGLNNNLDVSGILELSDQRIVISTISSGLFLFENGRWTQFTEKDGLPSNETFTVLKDDIGHLWVTGYRGLYQLPLAHLGEYRDGKREKIQAYMFLSESGGVIGSQKAYCCNGAGNAKGYFKDSNLWYPTRDGVISLNTQNIQLNPVIPAVLIEQVKVGDEWRQNSSGESVQLSKNQRDLSFDFTALSFRDPKSVLIDYRLIGYQEDWRPLENKFQRRVNYTNLPAGEYSFQVKAANNAGVWNPEVAELKFSIERFFYESWWFYLFLLSVSTVLVRFWLKFRMHSLQQNKIVLEQQIKSRTEQLEESNKKLNDAVAALQETSQTDQLSGLKNRRYLANQLPADLAHFERELTAQYDGDTMIFAIADIDHFKHINDHYGHKAGDDVICQLSELIRTHIREGDYAVRWGGEEFIVVFRPMPESMAPMIINRLREAIEKFPFDIGDNQFIPVTCSIGFAQYPFFKEKINLLSWEHTIELADRALYTVKEGGRNGWACFKPTSTTALSADLLIKMKDDLQQELDSGRLVHINNLNTQVKS